jgi:hypothetical protein
VGAYLKEDGRELTSKGRGASSVVSLAQLNTTRQLFAIKSIEKSQLGGSTCMPDGHEEESLIAEPLKERGSGRTFAGRWRSSANSTTRTSSACTPSSNARRSITSYWTSRKGGVNQAVD